MSNPHMRNWGKSWVRSELFEIQLCYKNIYSETSKGACETASKKGCVFNKGDFFSFKIQFFFMKLIIADEVSLQLVIIDMVVNSGWY